MDVRVEVYKGVKFVGKRPYENDEHNIDFFSTFNISASFFST